MVDGVADEDRGQGQGHQMDLEPPSQDAKTLFVGGLNSSITRYVCVCLSKHLKHTPPLIMTLVQVL